MLPNIVDDQIRLRERALECAAVDRAFEHPLLLLGVLGLTMELERGCVEKLLITEGALERQLSLMRFQMVVHSLLIFSCLTTMLTHETTIAIFCIGIDHYRV